MTKMMARGAALAAALLVQMHAMHAAAFTVQALGVRQPGCALAPRLALSRRSGVRAAHPTMGLVEAANSFPWALIPGTVAAGILFREGGLGSIGAFIDETFDYLDQKGGYIITEVGSRSGFFHVLPLACAAYDNNERNAPSTRDMACV